MKSIHRAVPCYLWLALPLVLGGCPASSDDDAYYGDDDDSAGGDSYWGNNTSNTESTGGGAQPHSGADPGAAEEPEFGDEPSNQADAGVQPVCDTTNPLVLYLSADDSNSMAGAVIARGIINQGQIVYKGLRTYEFLNYYNFNYPPAESNRVRVSAAMKEKEPGVFSLQLGVQAPNVSSDSRRAVNLTLAFDTSSSMGWGLAGRTGIDRARAVCQSIAGSLRTGDKVSMVTWGGGTNNVLMGYTVSGPQDAMLTSACNNLSPYGTSDLSGGLNSAYQLAQEHFDATRINRVVLVSDGGANVGVTDRALIAEKAGDASNEAIYLLGVGVGDPWNYNDRLMDAVTDSGKGAYIFVDSDAEAQRAFGNGFVRHVEVAARDVQVEVTLPPSFKMMEFHGEQYSTNPEEVEPQHLAMNDAMVFHQVIRSCARETLTSDTPLKVVARYRHPMTRELMEDSLTTTFGALLGTQDPALIKGDAVVAFAEALKSLRDLEGTQALSVLDKTLLQLQAAQAALPGDGEVEELITLLTANREAFMHGQTDVYRPEGPEGTPIPADCSRCNAVGNSLEQMRCAVDLCDDNIFLDQHYSSPTQSGTEGTYAAVQHFGATSNDLAPRVGGSYALIATGPATGRAHTRDMGGNSTYDEFSRFREHVLNAFEWKLNLRAPVHANGLRINHLFLSEEYDDFVGSVYNDKFYIILEAGSTNGGQRTVINYTSCRSPDAYYDFVCSPGMQYCTPRERYCFIAINTAASECCWLDGCPNGHGTTDITGTGFECASSRPDDSARSGSTTGWMVTEWPIEPGEELTLTFHIHDTGDGIYDSEAIIDGIQFLDRVKPGTRTNPL